MIERDPKEDCQALFDACVELAVKFIGDQRGFLPFGGAMKNEGELTSVAATTGEEMPSPNELIAMLMDDLKTQAAKHEIIASCICMDGALTDNTGKKSDAILCDVEHRHRQPMRLGLPYSISESGEIHVGNVVAVALTPKVFTDNV